MKTALQMDKPISQLLSLTPNTLRLDIQAFADSENTHPFAEEPTQPEPHPYADSPDNSTFARFADQPNPLLQPDNPTPPQVQSQDPGQVAGQQVEPQVPEQPGSVEEQEFVDFSGRKVPVIDPVIKDLHKDYTNLNKTYQTANQELQQARQLNEQYQSMLANQQQQTQLPEQQVAQQQQAPSPERMKQLDEEYMERVYESKSEADKWWYSQPEVIAFENERLGITDIDNLVNQKVNEILGPIQQERELQTQLQDVRSRFDDFDDVAPQIQQMLTDDPALANLPNAFERIYYMVKGQSSVNAPAAPSHEELLQNPQFQEQIIQNEQIRNMVMQNYQKSKMQQTQNIPTVMGSGAGTQTPMSAGQQTPRTISEGSDAFRRFLGQN